MNKKFLFVVFLLLMFFELNAQNRLLKVETDTTIYNRVWVLSRLNNRKINYKQGQERITLVITSENEYASGSSGCNTYVGQVVIKRNHIMFRDIGVTRMACPEENIQLERIYLNNLNDIDAWAIIDEDLYLYKNDRPVLIYSKD
ncbi:MAG: META domain-containing protein [Bacteroidales bacterium]|jgi:heat shock protein HslJ|nr:META domain-containing protein [Bacteroidales bacterium]MEE3412931.1 META domain-containing protein [Bacteroidales bacterium]